MTLRDQNPVPDPKGRPELKSTLLLPQTAFPMKANLPENEPKRLEKWQKSGLYEQIRQARKGAPQYILHDGPPYANGPIHLGHALNKCLKDFVVKSKTMAGFDSPTFPAGTVMVCPSRSRSTSNSAARSSKWTPPRSAPPAAPMHRSTSTC